jgi:hypothetical protein
MSSVLASGHMQFGHPMANVSRFWTARGRVRGIGRGQAGRKGEMVTFVFKGRILGIGKEPCLALLLDDFEFMELCGASRGTRRVEFVGLWGRSTLAGEGREGLCCVCCLQEE